MDPVTLMAGATASYNAVKRAIAAGQELESMIGSLSKWMSCLSDLDQAEREAKNPADLQKAVLRQNRRTRSTRNLRGQTKGTAAA